MTRHESLAAVEEDDPQARLKADAEQLSAAYAHNVDALWFQYNRRCFGSFTTTLAGSPEQRDRFFRAWKVAVARAAAADVAKAG